MTADIERTVIYDETVDAMPEILSPKSRLVITAGDDGFLDILEVTEFLRTGEGTIQGSTNAIGLTPPQITAIVAWANARAGR